MTIRDPNIHGVIMVLKKGANPNSWKPDKGCAFIDVVNDILNSHIHESGESDPVMLGKALAILEVLISGGLQSFRGPPPWTPRIGHTICTITSVAIENRIVGIAIPSVQFDRCLYALLLAFETLLGVLLGRALNIGGQFRFNLLAALDDAELRESFDNNANAAILQPFSEVVIRVRDALISS